VRTRFALLALLAFLNTVALATEREWEPLRPRDYWIDAGLALGAFTAYTQLEQQDSRLGRANLVDESGRSAFRFSSRGQRHDAEVWSNVALTAAIAIPVGLDPALAWARDKSRAAAARIWNIDAQAFGLTAVLTGTAKALIGRERPYVHECRRNPQSDPGCLKEDKEEGLKSFYSGHSVYAFTGAGLTCLHHTELRLYGDHRDQVACGSAIGLATVVALMRVGADKHYVTDVSSGALIGFLSGYLFPRFLHSSQPARLNAGESRTLWLPMVAEDDTYGLTHLTYF